MRHANWKPFVASFHMYHNDLLRAREHALHHLLKNGNTSGYWKEWAAIFEGAIAGYCAQWLGTPSHQQNQPPTTTQRSNPKGPHPPREERIPRPWGGWGVY